jgi:hypothetical protein
MGYKILGYAVWNGVKFYLSLRYSRRKRLAAAGLVGVAVVGLAVASTRKATSS